MIPLIKSGVPRFVELFGGRLRDWAEYLMATPGTIVAISRKGPRLLEILVREGLLPPSFMERVVTERILPFLNESHLPLVIIDDHVCWGSTFARIYRLAQQSAEMCSRSAEVIGVPFAVNKDASEDVLPIISKFFLSLNPEEVAPFVNNEGCAFRMLGKPFDIEHPMFTISGDFDDLFKTEALLQSVASLVHGRLIRVFSMVPSSDGPLEINAWSIFVDTCATGRGTVPDFCKLRVYLNPERNRLVIAAMHPRALPQSSLRSESKLFGSSLDRLWCKMVEMVPPVTGGRMRVTIDRSLAMWANFLNAMPLLRVAKESFEETLAESMEDFEWHGPTESDLRLLIAPSLAGHMQSALAGFLSEPQQIDLFSKAAYQCKTCGAPDEWIPADYAESYREELSRLLSKADDVDLVLQALFYAQHRGIELASRRNDLDSGNRLEFGITFNKIREEVHKVVPEAEEADIHRCFDRLIDEGCIVPRYSNFGQDPDPLWVRTFRVGEGPHEKMLQTVRLLFESLADKVGESTLPRLLFEKFCVLALSVASDHRRLLALRELNIFKGFHLYGARMVISTGKEQRFLLDWAVDQGIIGKANPAAEQDETRGQYVLNDLEDIYPRNECPWDDEVKYALEDLATITAAIHNTKGLKGSALVLVTSLASDQEFHRATEAELDLWLHDRSCSITHVMQALGQIARKVRAGDLKNEDLAAANNIISRTANFSAQVAQKKALVDNRQKLYAHISALVADNPLMYRLWHDIYRTLESRIISEANASGLTQVLSALRVAHVTNNLLRDLLAHAGYRDTYGRAAKSIDESLEAILRTLKDRERVDEVAKSAFFTKGGSYDICELIENVKATLPLEFSEALAAVRPIVSGIIECCEQILRDYGSADFREPPQTLEPPQYIMMWDVRGSTDVETREREIDPLIEKVNRRIDGTLRDRVRGFQPESRDDGNGLVCSSFSDIIAVYQILNDVFTGISIRAGVEANVQGRLNYYFRSRALGGRAFEHAARIGSMFKELKTSPTKWRGDKLPIEPGTNYLIVGEFARRYAEKEGSWNFDGWDIVEPPGKYEPRVRASLPITVTIIVGKSHLKKEMV